MPTGSWDKRGIGVPGVAAQNQHIVYTEKLQVDQCIFCFFTRKTSTDQVRYSIHFVTVHNGSANGYRSRTLTIGHLLEQATFVLFVNIIFAMVSYINKQRIKLD